MTRFICVTIASSGLVTTITNASGACCLIAAPTWFITPALIFSRSSRLIPGLRGDPEVTTMQSAPSMIFMSVVPVTSDVDAQHRRRLEHVERLALGQAVDNVEEHDIAQSAQEAQMGTGGADVAGANKGDFSTLDHTLP